MLFGDLRKLIADTTFVWIEDPNTHFMEAGEAAALSNDFDAYPVRRICLSYCPVVGLSIHVGSQFEKEE